jgi:DNA-binding NarL/FixJ family response regulator
MERRTVKSILILAQYPIFGHGIKSLLGQATDHNIFCVPLEPERLAAHLRKLQPNVIIFDRQDQPEQAIRLILAHSRTFPETKVITLSPEENNLSLIITTQLPLRNLDDLVAIINQ